MQYTHVLSSLSAAAGPVKGHGRLCFHDFIASVTSKRLLRTSSSCAAMQRAMYRALLYCYCQQQQQASCSSSLENGGSDQRPQPHKADIQLSTASIMQLSWWHKTCKSRNFLTWAASLLLSKTCLAAILFIDVQLSFQTLFLHLLNSNFWFKRNQKSNFFLSFSKSTISCDQCDKCNRYNLDHWTKWAQICSRRVRCTRERRLGFVRLGHVC